jgi:adenylate kinase
MATRIVLLGPPGAGKGTHAKFISECYQIPHISTGDILRSRLQDGSELGKKAKSYMESGQLVPDLLVIAMMDERLQNPDAKKGFLLDGFPRTVEQAQSLDNILGARKVGIELVINFDVSEEVVVARLSGRRSCPKCGAVYHVINIPPKKEGFCDRCDTELMQRKDDQESTVRKRLQVYQEQTAPLIQFYESKGLLRTVDGSQKIEILQKILANVMA